MKNAGKVLVSGLIFAAAASMSAKAEDSKVNVYRPVQGLSHQFGSKLAVGYFLQKDGACSLNIFLAENTGDDSGPAASRLQVKVTPGENVKLRSEGGETLEITCGEKAATLEVNGGKPSARFAAR